LFHQDRYQDAVDILERATNREPDYEFHYGLLAAAYGQLNRVDLAQQSVATFNKLRKGSEGGKLTVQMVGGLDALF
jgi:predicted Zn-dependent protease